MPDNLDAFNVRFDASGWMFLKREVMNLGLGPKTKTRDVITLNTGNHTCVFHKGTTRTPSALSSTIFCNVNNIELKGGKTK